MLILHLRLGQSAAHHALLRFCSSLGRKLPLQRIAARLKYEERRQGNSGWKSAPSFSGIHLELAMPTGSPAYTFPIDQCQLSVFAPRRFAPGTRPSPQQHARTPTSADRRQYPSTPCGLRHVRALQQRCRPANHTERINRACNLIILLDPPPHW